jgi:hypothetical protein
MASMVVFSETEAEVRPGLIVHQRPDVKFQDPLLPGRRDRAAGRSPPRGPGGPDIHRPPGHTGLRTWRWVHPAPRHPEPSQGEAGGRPEGPAREGPPLARPAPVAGRLLVVPRLPGPV